MGFPKIAALGSIPPFKPKGSGFPGVFDIEIDNMRHLKPARFHVPIPRSSFLQQFFTGFAIFVTIQASYISILRKVLVEPGLVHLTVNAKKQHKSTAYKSLKKASKKLPRQKQLTWKNNLSISPIKNDDFPLLSFWGCSFNKTRDSQHSKKNSANCHTLKEILPKCWDLP